MKMMAKSRSDRYDSPEELQKEFYNLIQGKELIAEKEVREKEKEEKSRKIGFIIAAFFKKIFPKKFFGPLASFKGVVCLMALIIIGLAVTVVFLALRTFSSNDKKTNNEGEKNEAVEEQVFEEIKTLPAAIGMPSGKAIVYYDFDKDFTQSVRTGEQVSRQNSLCVSTVAVSKDSPQRSMLELSFDCSLEPGVSYVIWFTVRAGYDGTVTMETETSTGTKYGFAGKLQESVILRQIRLNTSSFKKCDDESVDLKNTNESVKLTSLKLYFNSMSDDYPRNRMLVDEFAIIKE